MSDPSSRCLFAKVEIQTRFAGWEILRAEHQAFPAANEKIKPFVTVIARKPGAPAAA